MRTTDHLLLGQYLLSQSASPMLHRHRHAFLLGCVEPDCNVLSYLRGMRRGEKLHGHNAENSSAFLKRCMADFDRNGISTAWDYFRLGTLLHYAADAFTAPHNRFWTGSLLEHRAYEAALHRRFAAMLESARLDRLVYREYAPLHEDYCAETPGMETDFRYILTDCASFLEKYLLPAEKEKGIRYEGFDHDRLVSASR